MRRGKKPRVHGFENRPVSVSKITQLALASPHAPLSRVYAVVLGANPHCASGQSIYNWEHVKTSPRKEQLIALGSIRGIGKVEARARLEER